MLLRVPAGLCSYLVYFLCKIGAFDVCSYLCCIFIAPNIIWCISGVFFCKIGAYKFKPSFFCTLENTILLWKYEIAFFSRLLRDTDWGPKNHNCNYSEAQRTTCEVRSCFSKAKLVHNPAHHPSLGFQPWIWRTWSGCHWHYLMCRKLCLRDSLDGVLWYNTKDFFKLSHIVLM